MPPTYRVQGEVTFDGAPIEEADILFEPLENAALRSEGGKIQNGKYSMKANPGKNKISIRGSRVIPGKKGNMGEPVYEDYIPAHYNTESVLKEAIAPNNDNRFDFKLTKKQ